MISLQLAIELRDAGLLIDRPHYFWARTKGTNSYHESYRGCCSPEEMHEVEIPSPTLFELILACGGKFRHLSRYEEAGQIIYKASGVDGGENVVLQSTDPETAVARLYLTTHKAVEPVPSHYPNE